MHNTVHVAKVT